MLFTKSLMQGLLGGYMAASLLVAAALLSKVGDPDAQDAFMKEAHNWPGAEAIALAVELGAQLARGDEPQPETES